MKELLFEIMNPILYGERYYDTNLDNEVKEVSDSIFNEFTQLLNVDEVKLSRFYIKDGSSKTYCFNQKKGEEIMARVSSMIDKMNAKNLTHKNHVEILMSHNEYHNILHITFCQFGANNKGNITYKKPQPSFWQRLKQQILKLKK